MSLNKFMMNFCYDYFSIVTQKNENCTQIVDLLYEYRVRSRSKHTLIVKHLKMNDDDDLYPDNTILSIYYTYTICLKVDERGKERTHIHTELGYQIRSCLCALHTFSKTFYVIALLMVQPYFCN